VVKRYAFFGCLVALLLAGSAAAQGADDGWEPVGDDQSPVGDGQEPVTEEAIPEDLPDCGAAKACMERFYALKAEGQTAALPGLLRAVLAAEDVTPQYVQQANGELGYIEAAAGDREAAARAFHGAVDGPDEALGEQAAAELEMALAYVVQGGREAREAGDYAEALRLYDVAEELGADPALISDERQLVEQVRAYREQLAAQEEAAAQTAPVVSAGKAPHPSEAASDPTPPPLPEEAWLEEFADWKADDGDVDDLLEMLDELEDGATGARLQRVRIERGHVFLDDGEAAQAGAAFLEALEGPDAGLRSWAELELIKLQRHFRGLAVQYTHLGDIEKADRAFRVAAELGADPQKMAYERAYIWGLDGDEDKAIALLEEAAEGPNRPVGEQAEFELAARQGLPMGSAKSQEHLVAHMEHREAERWDEADAELDLAEEEGAEHQLVELYRAYVDKLRGDDYAARRHFREVVRGENEDLRKQAKAELRYTAKPVWADIYADGFGWARVWPEEQEFDDFAWMLRGRVYLHPIQKFDFDPYLFAQISGDVRSRADGGAAFGGQPLIYADNTAIVGVGAMLRFWERRITVWGQVGAAFPWVKLQDASAVQLDAQAGVAVMLNTEGCRPPDGYPPYLATIWCAEFYGDAVYRNRPYHNVFFSARGRLGLHYLVTGPVAWAPVIEIRASKDAINDYWANLVDWGVMHRWRLMSVVGVDLLVGVHAGTLFGLHRVDLPPERLGYVDFRLSISAYVAF
jgi:hypothetical protein